MENNKSMQQKSKKLPALQSHKTKSTLHKDKLKIEDLFRENAKNRLTHKDYRHDSEYSQIKASNFLSRLETIESPDLIYAVTDHLSPFLRSQNKQNKCDPSQSEQARRPQNQFQTRSIKEERQQALNLAKWIDEKLQMFKAKKSITFMDIIDYKQTILNYALGRIIDSLTKKCKEEGQLLSLIWNNTFTMFEGVFRILATANQGKDQQKITDEKELHQIYQTNHNFLREQNFVLRKQNEDIFGKMKNVITWNKRLRKDRKRLFTQNRVLNYRNHTYHQALEQTVQMLLRTVPQPATIITAKKITAKLAKQKGRKKKFMHKQSDQQFSQSVKTFVYNWLNRNSCLNEDIVTFLNETSFNKEDRFMLEDIDDFNEIRNVNIYDFFKLFDVGVQVNPEFAAIGCQSEQLTVMSTETMTKVCYTVDHSCQTTSNRKDEEEDVIVLKKVNPPSKKQNPQKNYSRDKSSRKHITVDIGSSKSIKNYKKTSTYYDDEKGKRISSKSYLKNFKGHTPLPMPMNKDDVSSVNRSIHRRMDNVSVGFKDNVITGNEDDNCSISDLQDNGTHTKGPTTTRHLITNNSFISRLRSMKEISDYVESNTRFGNEQKPYRRKNKKTSVAYLSDGLQLKAFGKLNLKKKFNESYPENRKIMENNRQDFYDQIIMRRSFYGKKKVEFANFQEAEQATVETKEFLRGKLVRPKAFFEHSNYICSDIEKLTKKISGPSNIAKTKTLLNSQIVFGTITNSIQKIARIPPTSKVFVNSSLANITKYIEGLLPDYIKQIKKEKDELTMDYEKALYPLNILLMEQMTFKYGLKGIAEKKIKNFIQKVLTFSPISEKVGLFSLLLGLEDPEVGSDELLVYVKCLVYFDCKKAFRDTIVTDSTNVDVEVVRQNLRKVLEYFFDHEYINLVELKLEIYFKQTAPYSTVEGITIIIIKELLKRKRQLKEKYTTIYQLCAFGDNFFTNLYKIIKVIANYRRLAQKDLEQNYPYHLKQAQENNQNLQALQKINKNRGYKRQKLQQERVLTNQNTSYDINNISRMIAELLKRSDVIDEEFGKSITCERFITAAAIYGIPTFHQLQMILNYFRSQLEILRHIDPIYESINPKQQKGVDKLAKTWMKELPEKSEEAVVNLWSMSRMYSQKIEDEVTLVMGKVGTLGLYIESSMLNIEALK